MVVSKSMRGRVGAGSGVQARLPEVTAGSRSLLLERERLDVLGVCTIVGDSGEGGEVGGTIVDGEGTSIGGANGCGGCVGVG